MKRKKVKLAQNFFSSFCYCGKSIKIQPYYNHCSIIVKGNNATVKCLMVTTYIPSFCYFITIKLHPHFFNGFFFFFFFLFLCVCECVPNFAITQYREKKKEKKNNNSNNIFLVISQFHNRYNKSTSYIFFIIRKHWAHRCGHSSPST